MFKDKKLKEEKVSNLTAAQMEDFQKAGKMKKKGGKVVAQWQDRYFFLKDKNLYYCKGLQDPDPLRYLTLTEFNVDGNLDSEIGRKFSIALIHPNLKNYFLSCETEEDKNEWLAAMNAVAGRPKVSVEDFDIMAVVGRGSFGKVMQVKHKATGGIYAMKVLRKDAMVRGNQIKNAISERNILQKIIHPFLVGLKFAFQTGDKLYMVLDYVNGGELFFHLQNEGKFDEDRVRLYSAEILLALEHLHDMNIVYRDLKPENILMTHDGHLKLTDFGLAKEVVSTNDKTSTFCGSPEYLAPELLRGEDHGKAVDWWTFGTIVYEMLAGLPPFYSKNHNQMFEMILNKELEFPEYMSSTAKDLLGKLLERNPTTRLGTATDATEIKAHPFFDSIDFEKVYNLEYKPTFTPKIQGEGDVSNFDPLFTKEAAVDSVVDSKMSDMMKTEAKFKNFTFVSKAVIGDDDEDEGDKE
eukprot:GFYU01005758.1.p1 GENE.GFYU01005758.1~~GFYU01005758.1.p1  ORF type:complete len:466 (-),score=161.18 GFYU01005758.1:888-2285(-)